MPKRSLSLSLDLIARAHPDSVRDDPTALALLTDDELGPGLTRALTRRPRADGGLWVFGYGSLIWQPEFAFTERRTGTVRGYHRRFCLLQRRFRGSPGRPGLVLALDRGGLCRGVAFRLPGDDPHVTLLPVWRREMRGNGYESRWVVVETTDGPVTALTFVVNRASDRYTGRLTEAEIADRIATGAGHLGPSAEYLFRTAEACAREGILDAHLWNLQALVAERLGAMVETDQAPAGRVRLR
ncbi:gamma-glutamylcyclotransferase [Methylobacterium sp. J-090]|uniref:gamma-glutamylcyclotransferase n=1 Tax=Methylobacterium sp. J-090 TaxID=2836666 RepID=UPI001FB879CF|nr:gamma-glutamylcyclotransferase [Methylobacterium sp. J-090]MCJ2084009.1 gamma-glutamylcyclotransferase [Methylobacterium sp. J-090]